MLLTCLAKAPGNGPKGRTRLHYAAYTGDLVRIRALVKAGADINALDYTGATPLMWACGTSHEDAAHLLLDLGADGTIRKDKYGTSALHFACHEGFVSVIRRLVEMGADINALDNNGSTPLVIACISGHEAAAFLLLHLGADGKTWKDGDGRSALYWACMEGLVSVIRRLVDMGADINQQDNDGITPLIWACESGKEAMAHLLLEFGADVNRGEDEDGRSALHLASRRGLVSVIRRLVDMGADINQLDNNGTTPLVFACSSGNEAAALPSRPRGRREEREG
jgi:ankyrin repeat protein